MAPDMLSAALTRPPCARYNTSAYASDDQERDEPEHSSCDDSSTGKRYDEMATKRESRERRNGRKYGEEAIAQNQLEAWPNPNPERDYVIHFEIPEFTCLCPRSGYPDFATIVIDYVPEGSIVELKSLKLYINGYRDRGISHEAVANTILDDLAR